MTALNQESQYRWWENYFIRYLLGSIIGSIIIYFAAYHLKENKNYQWLADVAFTQEEKKDTSKNKNTKEESKAPESNKNINEKFLYALPLLGFAFCYIASTPILFLHTARRELFRTESEFAQYELTANRFTKATISKEPFRYTTLNFWSLIIDSILLTILIGVNYTIEIPQNYEFWINSIFYFLFFLYPITLIHLAFLSLKKSHFEYSRKLNNKKFTEKTEIIDSYSHLREHGNAYFIVWLEILLGASLWSLAETHSPEWLIAAVIIWITPAIFTWFIGTIREFQFANE